MSTIIEPAPHKKIFDSNMDRTIEGMTKANRDLITEYLRDMEQGINVTGSLGARSYSRLNTAHSRLTRVSELLNKHFGVKDLTQVKQEQLHSLFSKMGNGSIKKKQGKGEYKSTKDYIKSFKAFWHWYQKKNAKKGVTIFDITTDLDANVSRKPDFVYFTIDSLNKLMDDAKYFYRVLMFFMFDSGIRSPKELMNVRRKDIFEIENSDKFELYIREESSKTFGRRIKLMLCCDILAGYLERNNFKPNDFIFKFNPKVLNDYLRALSQRVFGKHLKDLKENKSNKTHITMYDFRHSSACYWVPKYKSESALKYRFGWKKSDMIHYYTEHLGMKDTINDEDMYTDISKNELEKEIIKQKEEMQIMKDQLNTLHDKDAIISKLIEISSKRELDDAIFKKLVKVMQGVE